MQLWELDKSLNVAGALNDIICQRMGELLKVLHASSLHTHQPHHWQWTAGSSESRMFGNNMQQCECLVYLLLQPPSWLQSPLGSHRQN